MKYLILFLIGGFGYGLMEVAFRGFTHWSMIITGGSAFLCLYILNEKLPNMSIFIKALLGAIIITVLEFTVGIVVNKIFNLNIWDYSSMPANIMGIISLPFSICWYVISFISMMLFNVIRLQKV